MPTIEISTIEYRRLKIAKWPWICATCLMGLALIFAQQPSQPKPEIPTEKKALAGYLGKIADAAKNGGELSAATVLYTLSGMMLEDDKQELTTLADFCALYVLPQVYLGDEPQIPPTPPNNSKDSKEVI